MGQGIGGRLPAAAKVYAPAYVYKSPRSKYWRCESHVDVDIKPDGKARQYKTRERAQKRCDELNASAETHDSWLQQQAKQAAAGGDA